MPNLSIRGGTAATMQRVDSSASQRSGVASAARPLARAVTTVRQDGTRTLPGSRQASRAAPPTSQPPTSMPRGATAAQRPPTSAPRGGRAEAAQAAAPSAQTAAPPTAAKPVCVVDGPMLGVELELHGVRVSGAGLENKTTLARTAACDAEGNPLLKLVVDGAHRDKPCIEIVTAPHAPRDFGSGPLRDALDQLQSQCKLMAGQSRNARARPEMSELVKNFNAALKGDAVRYRLADGGSRVYLAAPGPNDKRSNDYQQTNVMVPYAALAQPGSGIGELFFSSTVQRVRFDKAVAQANAVVDDMLRRTGQEGDAPMVRAFLCQMIYQDSLLNEKAGDSEFNKDVFPFFIKTTLHDALFSLLGERDVQVLTLFTEQADFSRQMKHAIRATFADASTRVDYSSADLVLHKDTLRFRAGCEPQELQWSNLKMDGHEVDTATVSAIDRAGQRKDFFANANLEYEDWTRGHIVSPYIGSRLPAFLDRAGQPYVVAEARKDQCLLNKDFGQALASPAFQKLMRHTA